MTIERDKGNAGQASTLVTGAHVRSGDGQDLGAIKQVEGGYFKVDAPMQRDYWLSSAEIESAGSDEVVVAFDKSTLDAHKLTEPGTEAAEDPFRDMTVAPVISSEELLDQRARMERELAEQSRHLRNLAPTPTENRERREEERIPQDHSAFRELAGETVPYAPAVDEQEYRKRAEELIDATPVARSGELPADMRDDQRVTVEGREPSSAAMMIDELESTTAVGGLTPAIDGEPISSPIPNIPLAARDVVAEDRATSNAAPDRRESAATHASGAGDLREPPAGRTNDPTPHPAAGDIAYPADAARTAPYAPVRHQTPTISNGRGGAAGHPTPGETAFPAAAGRTAPYAPVSQQPAAPPIKHDAMNPTADVDPKTVFERVTSAASGPIREVDGEPKTTMSRLTGIATSPVVVAGALATVAFTVPMYVARRTGVSKLDLPMLLGSFVRKPDGKARLIGLVPHALQSTLLMPSAYRAGFRALGVRPSAKSGLMLAVPHLAYSATAAAVVGKLNPRAVARGDEKLLEHVGHVKAPGFAGRRYGLLTVASFVVGHAIYGAIIGWWLGKSETHHPDDVLSDQPTL